MYQHDDSASESEAGDYDLSQYESWDADEDDNSHPSPDVEWHSASDSLEDVKAENSHGLSTMLGRLNVNENAFSFPRNLRLRDTSKMFLFRGAPTNQSSVDSEHKHNGDQVVKDSRGSQRRLTSKSYMRTVASASGVNLLPNPFAVTSSADHSPVKTSLSVVSRDTLGTDEEFATLDPASHRRAVLNTGINLLGATMAHVELLTDFRDGTAVPQDIAMVSDYNQTRPSATGVSVLMRILFDEEKLRSYDTNISQVAELLEKCYPEVFQIVASRPADTGDMPRVRLGTKSQHPSASSSNCNTNKRMFKRLLGELRSSLLLYQPESIAVHALKRMDYLDFGKWRRPDNTSQNPYYLRSSKHSTMAGNYYKDYVNKVVVYNHITRLFEKGSPCHHRCKYVLVVPNSLLHSVSGGRLVCRFCFKQKYKQCGACLEELEKAMVVNTHGECHYCYDCLNQLFTIGLSTVGDFPPKCCGNPLEARNYLCHLGKDVIKRYVDVLEEYSASSRVYCAKTDCATFIASFLIKEDRALCKGCLQETCVKCRKLVKTHDDLEAGQCPVDVDEEKLRKIAQEKEWKSCPGCGAVVERAYGCNHTRYVHRARQRSDETDCLQMSLW